MLSKGEIGWQWETTESPERRIAAAGVHEGKEPVSTTRIIVVEDESIIAMDVEETLREAGFQVVSVACSLREAFAVLSEHPTDLMVVDLDTSGLELPLPWLGIPVVLLTRYRGSKHPGVLALANRCACPNVTKPFLAPVLLAAVACVLRPSARQRQAQVLLGA